MKGDRIIRALAFALCVLAVWVVVLAALVALSFAAPASRAPKQTVRIGTAAHVAAGMLPLLERIEEARAKTRRCERELALPVTPVSQEPISGREYARWVLTLWRARARATCRLVRALRDPRVAIRAVFGPVHGPGAVVVAECESGLSPWAANGQYLGAFQMGSSERARYGHGDTVLEQARAAHRYFVSSGSDWSPWQCRPNGGLGWA